MGARVRLGNSRAVAAERANVYVEVTKPRITAMVLLTVAVGFVIAPMASSSPWALVHVLVGACLSCSGAGALNQYLERDRDSVMARTRFRPLPSRRVSCAAVLALGTILSAGGVSYLAVTTNALTALIDALTLVTYLFVYTPLKRVSPLSTVAGAVPGALPPVMGWTAAAGAVGSGAFVLFATLYLWQIPHFLAIGRMYRDDYESAGFPMLVVTDTSGRATGRQIVLYAAALLPVSLGMTMLGLTGTVYFFAALVAGMGYLWFAVAASAAGDRPSARRLLLASVLYLPVLFAALLADGFVR